MGKIKGEKWWKEKSDSFIKSGKSISQFSRLNDLKKSTFNGWVQKFKVVDNYKKSIASFSKISLKELSIRKIKVNGISLEFEDITSYEEAIKFVIKYDK